VARRTAKVDGETAKDFARKLAERTRENSAKAVDWLEVFVEGSRNAAHPRADRIRVALLRRL